MLEAAIQYFLVVIANETSKGKFPDTFARTSTEWVRHWLSGDVFEKLASALPLAEKQHFLEAQLDDLLKIPEFKRELSEKVLEFTSLQAHNSIHNSSQESEVHPAQFEPHYNGTQFSPPPLTIEIGNELINRIQNLIANGSTENALGMLKETTQKDFQLLYRDVINISNHWVNLQRKERIGALSFEEIVRIRAQINDSILSITEELQKRAE